MDRQPQLVSERLVLRELSLQDAPRIQLLASDKRIADMTANIPHPYPDNAAVDWITQHESNWQLRKQAIFGIILKSTQEVIGSIGLAFRESGDVELGYWVGVDYWGSGYATEAVKGIVAFGFNDLELICIKARRLSRNPASGKVLLKSGFVHTGKVEDSCGSKFESLDHYEITAELNSVSYPQ